MKCDGNYNIVVYALEYLVDRRGRFVIGIYMLIDICHLFGVSLPFILVAWFITSFPKHLLSIAECKAVARRMMTDGILSCIPLIISDRFKNFFSHTLHDELVYAQRHNWDEFLVTCSKQMRISILMRPRNELYNWLFIALLIVNF